MPKLTNAGPSNLNTDGVVLRASPRTYWQFVKSRSPRVFVVSLPLLAGAILTSVSALLYSRLHPDYAVTLLGLSVGGGVAIGIAAFVYQHVYASTACIQLDSNQLVRTAWFARRRSYLVKDIGSVRRRSIELRGMLDPGFLVENKQGRPLFWLLASRWDRTSVERLWRDMGLTVSGSWEDRVDYYSYSDIPRW
jgi:hypothetical protein